MVLIIETWKPVIGFEGLYEVSDLGRVRSLRGRHGVGAVLNPKLPTATGQYMAVSLHKDGARVRRHVHRLVADAFLPPRPSAAHEVRHIDGNRAANYADNLAWGTRKDNSDDRQRHGRTAKGDRHGMFGRPMRGEENGFASLTADDVREIRSLAGSMKQRDIAARYGICQAQVWRVIHRKTWTHV